MAFSGSSSKKHNRWLGVLVLLLLGVVVCFVGGHDVRFLGGRQRGASRVEAETIGLK